MKFYAGIGSRTVTSNIKERQIHIAKTLANMDYTLRSGAATGSDYYFELGCDSVKGKKEIFLPERQFNLHLSKLYVDVWDKREEAEEIAIKFHPNWNRCTDFGKRCHTRNVAQVLGWDLNSPVDFVFCYTRNGKKKGGTAQAMRIAEYYNIPIYNLYYPDVENILKFIS